MVVNDSAPREFLTWQDIEDAVGELAGTIKTKPSKIVGIARGGMIPAVMLAHKLGVTNVTTIRLQMRADYSRLNLPIQPGLNSPEVLFVDDLWDSGQTIRALQQIYGHASYAVLYSKSLASSDTNVKSAVWVLNDPWLVFPWEVE
jgi:hypoxanthine phosphoribosyltransferase